MEEVILGMCLRTIGFGETEWKRANILESENNVSKGIG